MRISRLILIAIAAGTPLIVTAELIRSPDVSFEANYAPTVYVSPGGANEAWQPLYPLRMTAPAIALDSPIELVGTNEKGDMAVPDGSTDNVGWYRDGTTPGDMGTAVFAAHVFAAFSELDRLPVGSDVYIEMSDGLVRHFVVNEIEEYALAELSPEFLFNRNDARRVSLITCAGRYQRELGTYDRRLVISATLVDRTP